MARRRGAADWYEPVAAPTNVRRASGTSPKEQIKTTALHLFHESGFKSVSVRDIMVQLGLTAGAMYNHFRSKEELLYSLISDSVEGIESYVELARDLSDPDDPASQLTALSYLHAIYQCTNRELSRVSVADLPYLPDKPRAELRARLKTVRRNFDDIVNAGVKAGVFDVDRDEIRLTVQEFGSMGTRLSDWYDPDGDVEPERMAELHARIVLRVVGSAPPPGVIDKIEQVLADGAALPRPHVVDEQVEDAV